jgi:phosphosulfolactate phosphohydrolase-like enzyme
LPEGQHSCVREIPFFDKLWICSCECNSEWKPYAVVVEKDGSIGAAPENLVVAEYMTHKAKKKQAKEEAAAEAKAKETETENETEQDA